MKIYITIFIVLFSLLVITGCKTGLEYEIDKLGKPIYVAAIGPHNEVVLRSADGKVLVQPSNAYISRAIANSLNVGDIFIPKYTEN